MLNREEKKILKDFDEGKFSTIGKDKLNRYKSYAESMMKKKKRITIRISEYDYIKIKEKALEEGLPYQTFISSIIHKFVNSA